MGRKTAEPRKHYPAEPMAAPPDFAEMRRGALERRELMRGAERDRFSAALRAAASNRRAETEAQ